MTVDTSSNEICAFRAKGNQQRNQRSQNHINVSTRSIIYYLQISTRPIFSFGDVTIFQILTFWLEIVRWLFQQ